MTDDHVSSAVSTVVRSVRDASGREWRVREMPPPSYDRRQRASLIFDCDAVIRRVRNYPPNWHELSDADLFALSLHA